MKSLRPLLCRCLAALLPLACTLHTGAASGSAAARSTAATKASAAERGAVKAADKPAPRAGGTAHKAGAHRSGATAAKSPGKRSTGVGARPGGPAKASAARVAKQKRAGDVAKLRPAQARLDFSGRKRVGQASYYARRFEGRRMADGSRMRLNHHNAASRTLPLGTVAKVTNLKTGRSAVVKIQDRGPFVKGRIVDLSPATARAVGLSEKDGVAPVEVAPIAVPMPDGSTRPGEGAREPMARTQVARARDND